MNNVQYFKHSAKNCQKINQLTGFSGHIIHRKGASPSEVELHNELHNLARLFYNGSNVLTIRDAARKGDSGEDDGRLQPGTPETGKVSLVTVETVSNRRRLEVPDDDSSFLLRAQVRCGKRP